MILSSEKLTFLRQPNELNFFIGKGKYFGYDLN